MVCGVDDTICEGLSWLVGNQWIGAKVAAQLLAFVMLIKSNIGNLATVASTSFAIYKWWNYREAVLHRRLDEYIAESDRRLIASRDRVIEIITRPDRRTKLRNPAFAFELYGVLERNNWDTALSRVGISSMDKQLTRSQTHKRDSQTGRTVIHTLNQGRLRWHVMTCLTPSGASSNRCCPTSHAGFPVWTIGAC